MIRKKILPLIGVIHNICFFWFYGEFKFDKKNLNKESAFAQALIKWRKFVMISFIQDGKVVQYYLDKVLEVLENKKRRSK